MVLSGTKYSEIAECFGIKEKSVQTRVYNMRKAGTLPKREKMGKEIKNIKHCECEVKHCKACNEKCMEYLVARWLKKNGFIPVGGGVYVQV